MQLDRKYGNIFKAFDEKKDLELKKKYIQNLFANQKEYDLEQNAEVKNYIMESKTIIDEYRDLHTKAFVNYAENLY